MSTFLRGSYLALLAIGMGCEGPTEPRIITTDLLSVEAAATTLVIVNRSPTDTVFISPRFKYLGVQVWMDVSVCAQEGLAPGTRRVIAYEDIPSFGGKSDPRVVTVVNGRHPAPGAPTPAFTCLEGPRLEVRRPLR